MNDIKETIMTYEQSIEAVHGRIQELHEKIAVGGGEGNPKTRALAKRRYLLYQQMWAMQQAVQSLEEYVLQVSKRCRQQGKKGEKKKPARTVAIRPRESRGSREQREQGDRKVIQVARISQKK